MSGPAPNGKILTWDFRMSDNQGAADGMGIGYFATPLYGADRPLDPAGQAGASPWERPVYPSSATVGLDAYSDIDEVLAKLLWH